MTEEEKKQIEVSPTETQVSTGTAAAPAVDDDTYQKVLEAAQNGDRVLSGFQGSYDKELSELYDKISNRDPFSYSINDDALYKQYADQYTQRGKQAMKDTMGQAAALTGGYGSTYAQSVGQQSYDSYLQSLNDIIPTLQQQAYQKYQDDGTKMLQDYSLLADKADDEYGKYIDELNRQQQEKEWAAELEAREKEWQQAKYDDLLYLISTTGYEPNEDELTAAGMSKEKATSLRRAYISSSPDMAYRSGQITAQEYWNMTGAWPAGYTPPSTGGGGGGGGYYGGGGSSGSNSTAETSTGTNLVQNDDGSVSTAGGSHTTASISRGEAQRTASQIASTKGATAAGNYLAALVNSGRLSASAAANVADKLK